MDKVLILSIIGGIVLLIISITLYLTKNYKSIILIDIVILAVILVLYIIYILNDNKLEKLKTTLDDNYIIINDKIRSLNRKYNKLEN